MSSHMRPINALDGAVSGQFAAVRPGHFTFDES
jgi:hypothetical protein